MKVKVLGKQNMKGTSRKTGKPFDSNVCHIAYETPAVEGQAVQSIWLDPVTYPLHSIKVGATYNAEYDNRGFLVSFTPC